MLSDKCCLSPEDEFIYRNEMEQIFSDFILSHVSFGSFLASRKEQKCFKSYTVCRYQIRVPTKNIFYLFFRWKQVLVPTYIEGFEI